MYIIIIFIYYVSNETKHCFPSLELEFIQALFLLEPGIFPVSIVHLN